MEAMLSFTQARHRMLTENIANVDTPHYRTQQLDAAAFQEKLSDALSDRRENHSQELRIAGTTEFDQDEQGRLVVTPTRQPAENVLFHDHTNIRIERQMAMLAENGMMHETMTQLLQDKYTGLLKAIRGRAT